MFIRFNNLINYIYFSGEIISNHGHISIVQLSSKNLVFIELRFNIKVYFIYTVFK